MICNKCGNFHYEFYRISDKAFKKVNNGTLSGFVCFDCAAEVIGERALKMELVKYKHVPINKIHVYFIEKYGSLRPPKSIRPSKILTVNTYTSEVLPSPPQEVKELESGICEDIQMNNYGYCPMLNILYPLAYYFNTEVLKLYHRYIDRYDLEKLTTILAERLQTTLQYYGDKSKE